MKKGQGGTMKNVLITGASGGIGRAAALAFAEKGYGVALHYRKGEASARKTAEEILSLGGDAGIFQAELTGEREIEQLFDEAEKKFGFFETLVNCAGTDWKGLLPDMTLEEWNHLFAVNCTGTFLCCRRALPPMIRKKAGCIVNVSSIWGQVGASCEAAYSASKAAVIGLTKALAKEVGPSGIRVNCVSPGVISSADRNAGRNSPGHIVSGGKHLHHRTGLRDKWRICHLTNPGFPRKKNVPVRREG